MTDHGDVGWAHPFTNVFFVKLVADSDLIHSLGDAALIRPVTAVVSTAGPNARSKTPFVILVEDAVPGEIYSLSKRGAVADMPRRAEADGLRYYDLDDGTYIAHSTQSASAFEIVVTGTSYVVTQLSGGGSVTIADNMYGGVA